MPGSQSAFRQQKWWFTFTLWERLVVSYLGQWEIFMGGPNTQLQLWTESHLKKVWGQNQGLSFNFSDHSGNQRSAWITMTHHRDAGRGLGGMGPLGWETGRRSHRWSHWEAAGGWEEHRCAWTFHPSFLGKQTEYIYSLSSEDEVLEERGKAGVLRDSPQSLPLRQQSPGPLDTVAPCMALQCSLENCDRSAYLLLNWKLIQC